MSRIQANLARHPFLKDLKASHVELLAECAEEAHFSKGSYMFRQGEKADRLCLVQDGKVGIRLEMPSHDPLTIMTLGPGGVVGWSWLVPAQKWLFDVWVMADTLGITLNGECLFAKCRADYELGYELMWRCSQIMADRLTATRLQLLNTWGEWESSGGTSSF